MLEILIAIGLAILISGFMAVAFAIVLLAYFIGIIMIDLHFEGRDVRR